ncbi:MAG TPA: fumarylacetoacetate hydrolase family protein [Saprospiraceae bacterium]|nr:fumarylacetoacetate hydrolase family protein [Saprospiraceae bacterium]HPN70992.1 fumarylacetoacetate hydrolase family protein [Saprospiraceae bacterium]
MKIFCIGRNYVAHAKELKNDLPTNPIIFMKPSTAMLIDEKPFYHPEFSSNIHFELELVLKISKNGKHISEKFANDYYQEIGLGIDFTARDLQNDLKEKGLPWELAKSFDNSAVVGKFLDKKTMDEATIGFSLLQNGQIKQDGTSQDLIFSFNDLIVYISKYFTLQKGDLIYTGTPAGVGKVNVGDVLEGFIGEQKLLHCEVK